MSKKIRASQIADAVRDMAPEHLTCRTHGHVWRSHDAYLLPRSQGWAEELRCGRCGTHRLKVFDKFGFIIHSSYREYPDGYQIVGVGPLSGGDRAQLRLAGRPSGMQVRSGA